MLSPAACLCLALSPSPDHMLYVILQVCVKGGKKQAAGRSDTDREKAAFAICVALGVVGSKERQRGLGGITKLIQGAQKTYVMWEK